MVRTATRRPRVILGLFLALGLILAFLAIRQFSLGDWGPEGEFSDVVTFSLSIIFEAGAFVFLGIFISILVQVFIPAHWLHRLVPHKPWARRAVISLLGFLFPVCECGNVPMSRAFMLRGFTPAESMTFLVAAPILNPIVIITTQQVFGWDSEILIGRLVFGFLMANLVGWVLSLHPRQEELLTNKFAETCRVPSHGDSFADETGVEAKFAQSVRVFLEETSVMFPALILGSFLAGLIQVLVPRDVLLDIGSNPVLSVFSMMLLAFVISICSSVDAFFALAFVSTFMPGAILAFLVLGPVLDLKLIAMIRTTYSTKAVVIMGSIVILVSAIAGMAVNLIA